MTNYEFLKSLSPEDLAEFYCHIHDEGAITNRYCNVCPFSNKCYEHNPKRGIENWLKEEHKVDKYGW